MLDSTTGSGSRPAISSATKMPWAKPRCASCSPGTMSPTAHSPSTLVRQRSSVTTNPRSTVTPASSYPRPGGDRSATDGDEQQVGVELVAVLEPDRDAGVVLVADEPHAGAQLIPRLRKARSRACSSRPGPRRRPAGEGLDDRDVGAERPQHAGELDADDAAAQDDDALGHPSSLSAWSLVMTRPPRSRPGRVRA